MIYFIGKKSPVYGKGKQFYFVLQWKDRKLLYYEHESVSRSTPTNVLFTPLL